MNQSERQKYAIPLFKPPLLDRSTPSQQLIHERVQRDLPSFNSQLAAAESIRSRLHALKDNTDRLSDAISNPDVRPHGLPEDIERHTLFSQGLRRILSEC